jgi:hypothetical protein
LSSADNDFHIMDEKLLLERLLASEQRNEALCRELTSLRSSQERVLEEFAALRGDYEALADATRVVTSERDAFRQRVAELEVSNNRLVDMLWGRRSERRSESPDQQHLNFGDGPIEPPSPEQQEIIAAQAKADEAMDQELLRRLAQRRKARREKQGRREEFPPHIERRERLLDLPEEQKQGLKCMGVKKTERFGLKSPTSTWRSSSGLSMWCRAGPRKACGPCRRRWRSSRAANMTSVSSRRSWR